MVLYLVPAFGITVSVHYCGGKLADVSVLVPNKNKPCACVVPTEKNETIVSGKCCEQLVFSLKLENQQLKASTVSWKSLEVVPFKSEPFVFVPKNEGVVSAGKQRSDYHPKRPPGRFNEPIYIQNESFLI